MSLHRELIDHDPITGLKTYIEFPNDDTKFEIRYEQDITASIAYAERLRNNEDYKKDGIKRGWWHAAHIPEIVILKLRREYGLDIFNPNHLKRIYSLINSNEFLKLQCTTGRFAK